MNGVGTGLRGVVTGPRQGLGVRWGLGNTFPETELLYIFVNFMVRYKCKKTETFLSGSFDIN